MCPSFTYSGQVMSPRFSEETGVVCCETVWWKPVRSSSQGFHAAMNTDDDLYREIASCQERLFQIEHEIELIGWLPTSHSWSLVERLSREYARLDSLWRMLTCPEMARYRRGACGVPPDEE